MNKSTKDKIQKGLAKAKKLAGYGAPEPARPTGHQAPPKTKSSKSKNLLKKVTNLILPGRKSGNKN
jgi:hypothetical protein